MEHIRDGVARIGNFLTSGVVGGDPRYSDVPNLSLRNCLNDTERQISSFKWPFPGKDLCTTVSQLLHIKSWDAYSAYEQSKAKGTIDYIRETRGRGVRLYLERDEFRAFSAFAWAWRYDTSIPINAPLYIRVGFVKEALGENYLAQFIHEPPSEHSDRVKSQPTRKILPEVAPKTDESQVEKIEEPKAPPPTPIPFTIRPAHEDIPPPPPLPVAIPPSRPKRLEAPPVPRLIHPGSRTEDDEFIRQQKITRRTVAEIGETVPFDSIQDSFLRSILRDANELLIRIQNWPVVSIAQIHNELGEILGLPAQRISFIYWELLGSSQLKVEQDEKGRYLLQRNDVLAAIACMATDADNYSPESGNTVNLVEVVSKTIERIGNHRVASSFCAFDALDKGKTVIN